MPCILRDTIEANDFPPVVRAATEDLYRELTGGRVRPLLEDAPDVAEWNEWSGAYFGRTWLDVPWYWAEAYFYRRLLEATGYFQSGPLAGVDPFSPVKRKEWEATAAPATVGAMLAQLSDDLETRFEQVLHGSLWGNRTDLSYTIAAHLGATATPGAERANLLVDDWAEVWEHLTLQENTKVGIVTDNAGTELLMDVVLADFLLAVRAGVGGPPAPQAAAVLRLRCHDCGPGRRNRCADRGGRAGGEARPAGRRPRLRRARLSPRRTRSTACPYSTKRCRPTCAPRSAS